jgi:hypothetical protein|tara:strand:+ start:2060 stop:2344 length:285 start_codon:yes stop_codon:yes gene_type:complete
MGRPKGSKNRPKTEDVKSVKKPVNKGRPAGSKNKPKVEPKRGRAKRPWHIEIFLDGKRKGAYNGETLIEAMSVAEEKLIYDIAHKEDKFYGHGN